jgi:hypothetical protein
MVAPNYALARSTLAKKMGLGRRGAADVVVETPQPTPEPARTASRKPRAAKKVAA